MTCSQTAQLKRIVNFWEIPSQLELLLWEKKLQRDKFPWIVTDLQKLIRLSNYYLAWWQSGWVRCKTEPWGSKKWALHLKADDLKCCCFCLSAPSLWQENRELWSDTFETTTDGYLVYLSPLFTVILCPAKSLSSCLFLQPIGHLRHIRSPFPWLRMTLAVLVPFDAPFPFVPFPKDEVLCFGLVGFFFFFLLCCSGSCPDSGISILLTAWPSCNLSACGLQGCAWELKEERARGGSWR